MTLQYFKDQVAREHKVWGLMRMYKDWAEVVQRGMCFQQVSILERAATLFAEHERKEGYNEGVQYSRGELHSYETEWVRDEGVTRMCHICASPSGGIWRDKPTCYDCATHQ